MGLVTLWWGTGKFNMDGGEEQERQYTPPNAPDTLISGQDFSISDLSIYLPMNYRQGIVADKRFRMSRVRVRIDRSWLLKGRGDGTVAADGRQLSGDRL